MEERGQADTVCDAEDVTSAVVALESEEEEEDERHMSVDREGDNEAIRGEGNKEKGDIWGEDDAAEEEVRGEDDEGEEEDKEMGEDVNCVAQKTVSKQSLKHVVNSHYLVPLHQEVTHDPPMADRQQMPHYAGKPLSFKSLLPTTSAEHCPTLDKYWSQRYRLFSRYDHGIQLDSGR